MNDRVTASFNLRRIRLYRTVLIVVLMFLAAAYTVQVGLAADQSTKQFRAGAATSNITPSLGVSINGGMRDRLASHIHDELHARCLVLDDGDTRLAFVVCDSCMIPRDVFDAAKEMIEHETGLPADHVLMSATHTHSAPASGGVFQSDAEEEYKVFLARRIADGVRRAINNVAPAKIGWGTGSVPGQVFNRRWYMKPGTIGLDPFGRDRDRVKMNPPRASEDLVRPAGPIDPVVSVVSVQSADGRPVALLANYSLHYVGGTAAGHISADYFGMFARRIEELLGAERQDPPFVGMLSNGTSGDINNINFREAGKRQQPYEQMRVVADAVAAEAHRVYRAIEHRDWVALDTRQRQIELGVRRPNAEEIARAKEILGAAEGPVLGTLPEVYARETVLLSEYPEKAKLVLQALRIGDLGIVAIPCETFVEIGLELRERSRFEHTFTIELANGYNGYLPTPAQHELGGYETWRARSSYLEVEASLKVVQTLMELLDELQQE